jgi:phospholipid/cholesterol/gamma-HCH transport system substrate-binding protein
MSGKADKFKIGLFVLSSLIFLILAVLWLGASKYFGDTQIVVSFFSETVQGLERDSSVKFRGVPVGRVRSIRMAPDGRLIQVEMALDKNFKVTEDLGVKMSLVGLTGMKYLEMDTFKPEQQREQVDLDFEPKYKVIPTYPSDIREIGTALENIFQRIKTVELDRISENIIKVTNRLDKVLADTRTDKLSSESLETLREIKEATRRINDDIAKAQPARAFTKTMDKTGEFLQESTETVRNADRLIRRTDNNLNRLSQKLERSADNLIDFTRIIRQRPSSILFGTEDKDQKK